MTRNGPSLLVGLTGGIASGKSTVAKMLRTAGCEVVDADQVVAELYASGDDGARAVMEIAGSEVLAADGSVDRPALASRLFADEVLRDAIEAAVHPLVRRRFAAIAAASTADIIVLEATLLVEAQYTPDFDLVIAVEADPEVRIERAVARGLDEAQARARLHAQGDGEERRLWADMTIHNDGSLEDLQAAVDDLMETLAVRLANRRSESGA